MDQSCDYITDFQMEVVSKVKCARSLIGSFDACRNCDCVDMVNCCTCDCDEDHELMLQVNGSTCVARNVKISLSNEFRLKVYGAKQC